MTYRFVLFASAPTRAVARPLGALLALGLLAVAPPAWAQTAGPPASATTPEAEAPAQPPPEIPPAPADAPPPADVESAAGGADAPATDAPAEPATPSELGLDFVGLWAGPEEADVGFTVEERVREALARPPFVLNDGPSSPMAPACLEDVACRAEKLGGRTKRWVVAGSLSGEATQLTLTLVLLAPDTAERVARSSVTETSNEEGTARLVQSIEPVVSALLQSLDPTSGPAVPDTVALNEEPPADDDDDLDEPVPVPEDETRSRLWSEEEDVASEDDKRKLSAKTNAPVAKAPAEASGGGVNYAAWIWSGSFLGVGALMAVGGVGFDLFSPTSVDDELGLADGVGPGLVLAGATVALVGLAVNPFLWMALAEEEGEADAQP